MVWLGAIHSLAGSLVVAISTAPGEEELSCLFHHSFSSLSLALPCPCPAATGALTQPSTAAASLLPDTSAASPSSLSAGRSSTAAGEIAPGSFAVGAAGGTMTGEANGDEGGRQQPQPLRGEEEEEEERRQPGQGPPQQQRTASRPSSGQQPPPPQPAAMRNVGYVGKHRLSAAIAHLDQELQSLQDELNELDTMEAASAACQGVITSTEGKPDPLLPITSGPENSSWDRWFQRVRSSCSNKWWASKGSDFS